MKKILAILVLAAMLFSMFAVSSAADDEDTEEVIDTEYQPGDVNGDGQTDTTDLILLKNHLLNISPLTGDYYIYADANGNGRIDTADYIIIKIRMLGLEK